MKIQVDIVVVEEDEVAPEQKDEMLQLQIACFADQVTAEEVEEDFNRPPVARVLAYHKGALIACAEVFKREVDYDEQAIILGGFSPCTREDLRGQGIGTLVCKAAMNYLEGQGCDIAFLSVDTERESHPLYERLGFKMLSKPFIYANIRGERRESEGGMIAPLCSQQLFERVLRGNAQFALTPEPGYW
ncbi:MAG: GNAT family N-acetyltransferase [Anaerolineae bacterium]|nr:GNAT family N-acetyltransferase [Anaerolineae bacterium]